jgi:tetratricopeptide (TPR) repeat protein
VTTASLPALRLYTEGSRAFAAGDYLAARDYLERAVAADSGFAMAWRRLGAAYYNTGAPVSQRLDAARRAFRHRDRLPPLERLLTEGYYHTDADPRPERAIAAYQAALDLVPDEMIAVNNLGLLLNREGRFAEAEEVLRRGIAAGGPATLLTNLNYSLISQKKWAAIDSLIAYADTGLPPGHHVRLTLRLDAAAGRRDYAQLHALLDTVAAPPTGLPEWVLLWERATALEAQGRFAEAVRTTAEIARLATEEGNAPLAADAVLEPVLQAYFRGDPAAARAELARVLGGPVYRELPDSLLPAGFLGIIYGAVGDPAGVRRMRELWERAHLEGGATRADSLSWIGHLAHAERRWRDAAEAYGGAHEARHCAPCGVFLAAHMWDMAGVPDSAAAWYRRGLDLAVTEENAEDAFFHPIALRRLGEIAEEQGRAAEALEWYQRFVDVWRDADPELQPVVRGARERIARLTAEPR